MLTLSQKLELQNEFSLLISANLKKDGTPKKKADPAALLRIAKIRELAKEQNRLDHELRREARKERELAFIRDSGFNIGQKVKFTVSGKDETGIVTACVNLPCQLNSDFLPGRIGVSIDGSAPYMFRPEELAIV